MSRRGAAVVMSLVLAGVAGIGAEPEEPQEKKVPTEEVVVADDTFQLELAADREARRVGLSGRASIDPDGGMLFVFPVRQRPVFWMKDCLIDIDLLMLDDRGAIVALHEMKTEPPRGEKESEPFYERRLKRYRSRPLTRFAIELPAGSIERLDLEAGETIDLDFPRLTKLARDNEKPPERRPRRGGGR